MSDGHVESRQQQAIYLRKDGDHNSLDEDDVGYEIVHPHGDEILQAHFCLGLVPFYSVEMVFARLSTVDAFALRWCTKL